MKPSLARLRSFVRHPATQLTTGVILLVSGGSEAVLDFLSAERSFHLGAHHGVALFGLIQMLGSLPEVIDGLTRSIEAEEKHHDRARAVNRTQNEQNDSSVPASGAQNSVDQ